MCLIAFAYKVHPKYPLLLAANRDEFYERPTSYAKWWEDQPNILAGRDLEAKGTWMGYAKNGRFAALTNYRDPKNISNTARTRGEIPTNFLLGNQSATDYLKELDEQASNYNGFNILLLDDVGMYHYSNYERKINEIKPGIYGLSNALLNTPWPKVEKLKAAFSEEVQNTFDRENLLNILQDHQEAETQDLPNTGVPEEWEKKLSSVCIRTENYGTCCSTVIKHGIDGKIKFFEKSYAVGNRESCDVQYEFQAS